MPLKPTAPTILIADDDEMIRDLLRTRLEIAGYATVSAEDGVEAFSHATQRRLAAMLLDVNMPRMDGFQVLDAVRRSGRPLPPTLMLTARHANSDVRKALALGAKDYMAKPFDDQMLLRRVARLLRTLAPDSAKDVLL